MGTYLFTDPSVEQAALNEINARRRTAAVLRQQISPQIAENAGALADYYPSLSGSVIVQAAMMGLQPGDERLEEVAQAELEAGMGIWDRIKSVTTDPLGRAFDPVHRLFRGSVRTSFVAFDSLQKELISRPFQAFVGALQEVDIDPVEFFRQATVRGPFEEGIQAGLAFRRAGVNPIEQFQRTGPSEGVLAIRELLAGRPVNLGSGFLPQSDPTQEGRLISQESRIRQDTGVRVHGTSVSPGRILAHTIVPPGKVEVDIARGLAVLGESLKATANPSRFFLDREAFEQANQPSGRTVDVFDVVSGAGDFGVQVALDPTAGLLKAAGVVRQASKVVGVVEGSTRAGLIGRSADSWLASGEGRDVLNFLASTEDFLGIRRILNNTNDRRTILAIRNATTPEEVANILRPRLGVEIRQAPGSTGVSGRLAPVREMRSRVAGFTPGLDDEIARAAGLGVAVRHSLSQTRVGHLFTKLPGHQIDAENLDQGIEDLDRFMHLAEFDHASRNEFLEQLAGVADNDYESTYVVMVRVMERFNESLKGDGVSLESRQAVTQLFEDQRAIREYFNDLYGRPVWFPGSRVDDTVEGIAIPSAHLVAEYANRAVTLPDPREVRRAISTLDPLVNFGRAADDPVGAGVMVKALDATMQNVWKPMVLLRAAWTVRVILEEQVRMAAAGLDSVFNHPINWARWMMARDDALTATGRMAEADAFQAAMSRSNGWFDPSPRTLAGAGWVEVGPKNPRFYNAWARDLNQLVQDEISQLVAREGVDGAVDFLKNTEEGRSMWARYTKGKERGGEIPAELLEPDAIDAYVQSVELRIALKTGGKGTGPMGLEEWRNGVGYEITDPGNQELRDMIATGFLRDVWVRGAINDERIYGGWVNRLRELVDAGEIQAPRRVKGPFEEFARNRRGVWDKTLQFLFSAMMGGPTDRLSRGPAFSQYYWNRIVELMPAMDDASRAHFLNLAEQSKVPPRMLGRLKAAAAEGSAFRSPPVTADDLIFTRGPQRGVFARVHEDAVLAEGYVFHGTRDAAQVRQILEGGFTTGGLSYDPTRSLDYAGQEGYMLIFRQAELPENVQAHLDVVGDVEQLNLFDPEAAQTVVLSADDLLSIDASRARILDHPGLATLEELLPPEAVERVRVGIERSNVEGLEDALFEQLVVSIETRAKNLSLRTKDGKPVTLSPATDDAISSLEVDGQVVGRLMPDEVSGVRYVPAEGAETVLDEDSLKALEGLGLEWGPVNDFLDELSQFDEMVTEIAFDTAVTSPVTPVHIVPAKVMQEAIEEGVLRAGSFSDDATPFIEELGALHSKLRSRKILLDTDARLSEAARKNKSQAAPRMLDAETRARIQQEIAELEQEIARLTAGMDLPVEVLAVGPGLSQKIEAGDRFARNVEDIDTVAKAYALEQTQRLLYDLSDRGNVEDILRNVFPFANAWKEILQTWSRLVVENPATLRRGQQVVEGMREAGFFQTDPQTGEEVFTYPMLGPLASMSGVAGGTSLGAEFVAPVQGVNLLAGSVLPGAGPVIQIPASALLRDRAGFNWLRDILLPFGETDVTSVGDLVNANLPPWMRRTLTAMGRGDEQMVQTMGNTTVEVLRAMEMSGEFDHLSPGEKVRQAQEFSQRLMWIRAGAQFAGPTGPRPVLTLEDEDGQVFWLSTLAQSYREILEEAEFDSVRATDEFVRRYGWDPMAISVSKSAAAVPRSTTRQGLSFELKNPRTFREFPLTAMYAGPSETVDDFDYSVWVRRFQEGERLSLTPEQWLWEANDARARYLYDLQKDRLKAAGLSPTDGRVEAALRAYRIFLMDEFPGAFRSTPGVPQPAELGSKIEELKRWSEDPVLARSEAGQALAQYLANRNAVVQAYIDQGGSEDGFRQAKSQEPARAALAAYAEQRLIPQYPEFEPLWRFVLSNEVSG